MAAHVFRVLLLESPTTEHKSTPSLSRGVALTNKEIAVREKIVTEIRMTEIEYCKVRRSDHIDSLLLPWAFVGSDFVSYDYCSTHATHGVGGLIDFLLLPWAVLAPILCRAKSAHAAHCVGGLIDFFCHGQF